MNAPTPLFPPAASVPAAEPRRHPLTVEAVRALVRTGVLREDDRVELIRGQLFDKMSIGPTHVRVVNALTRLFISRTDAEVSVQNPVQIGDLSAPEPDLALLRETRDPSRLPTPADVLLVVEVADTSLTYDRDVKLPLYAGGGIPEVWIVDLAAGRLEAYREPAGDHYKRALVLSPGDAVDVEALPDAGRFEVGRLLGSPAA